MTPTVRRILLSQSLEKKVQAIVRRNGIAMYVPVPGVTCFQDSACTTPANVDDPIGGLKDYLGLYPATQSTSGYRPILRGKVTNWILYSNDFSNSSWIKTNCTISANVIIPDTNASSHQIIQNLLPLSSSGTIVTASVKVKASGYNYLGVGFWNQGNVGQTGSGFGGDNNTIGAVIDIANGLLVNKSPLVTSINISEENGDYVVSATYSTQMSSLLQLRIFALNSNNYPPVAFSGDGLSGVEISHVQVELGSIANPYVPTTSAPASSSYGPYWLGFDGVDDVLSISGLSAFTSAAVIKSVKNTGYSIQTAQDISAGYSFNTKFSNALMLAKSTPSSSELAVIKKYFDRLVGVA